MASKKQMQKRIADLEAQVRRLENMHATILPRNSWEMPSFMRGGSDWEDSFQRRAYYNGRQLTRAEITLQPFHPQPEQVDFRRITNVPAIEANTDRVSGVTFEELARLVVDHKPIRREEEVKAKCISEYTEDSTTKITIHE